MQFQEIGNAHATLLFNIIICMLWSGVLYLHLCALRVSRFTALSTTLIFAFTTIVWPYSKNFFREPLAGLMLSSAAYAVLRLRNSLNQSPYQILTSLLLVVAFSVLGILSKEAVIIGLPIVALQFATTDRLHLPPRQRRILLLVVVLIGLSLFLALYYYQSILNAAETRFQFINRIQSIVENNAGFGNAVAGFLFSPGKSLFVYSPVVLLSCITPFIKAKRKLEFVWPLLLIPAFVIVYALIRGDVWFGGLNWGPRYMVPITGLLMLPLSLLIEHAHTTKHKALITAICAFSAVGFLVQIGAVAVNPLQYYQMLDQTGVEGAAWVLGIWQPQYSAAIAHLQLLFSDAPFDFAWYAAAEQPLWTVAIALSLAAFFNAFFFRWQVSKTSITSAYILPIIGIGICAFVTAYTLTTIYVDSRYSGQRLDLQAMRLELEAQIDDNTLVALDGRQYMWFMMNYFKGKNPVYTIAENPADKLNGQPIVYKIGSIAYLDESNAVPGNIGLFAGQNNRERIAIVANNSQFDNANINSMEWWLHENFHLLSAKEFANDIRLVEVSATPIDESIASFRTTRERYQEIEAEFNNTFVFDERIALIGYDANPTPGIVAPGTILNISTVWEPFETIEESYVIATFLVNPQSQIEMQIDALPQNGFWPTSAWTPGDQIRHNVAFALSEEIAPGHYEIWTILYNQATGERLQVANAEGTSIRDHVVLFSVEVTR